MGKWRRLHNEKIYDLYSSLNIILGVKTKNNGMGGACGTYGGEERCMQNFW